MLACIAVTALPASAARTGAYPGGNGAIAFVQYSSAEGWTLSAMNPDGSAVRRLLPASISRSVGPVAWSPDGRRLAFLDQQDRLSVVNSNGTGHRVVADHVWRLRPSWSPSGEEIAAAVNDDGTLVLMAIRADGSSRRELVPRSRLASFDDFAWSSTGKIAMRRKYGSRHPDAGKQALVTMDDGGGNETVIFRPVHQAPAPEKLSWSPDGSRIAFQLMEYLETRTETTVNVINADGSNRRKLGVGTEPAWSPDGGKILYTTGDPAQAQHDARISVMNPDGSAKKELRRGMHADWQPCRPGATCRLAAPTPAKPPPRRAAAPLRGRLTAAVTTGGFALLYTRREGINWSVTKLKAGVYAITVRDRSRRHNFHLVGVGVDRRTSAGRIGTFRWRVKLNRGKLTFFSDRLRAARMTVTVS